MPHARTARVLAIAPGSRHLGIALFEGQELIRFGVKTFHGKKTKDTLLPKLEQYLEEFRASHQPTSLAIEEVFYAQARLSPLLQAVVSTAKRWGRRRGLSVVGYTPKVVKHCLSEGKPTRRSLAQTMVRRYLFLRSFLKEQHTRRAQEYWQQMFDAVALGTVVVGDAQKSTNPH